ncbi:hypothetical protein V3C99_017196 [Haemonchus contortus]
MLPAVALTTQLPPFHINISLNSARKLYT